VIGKRTKGTQTALVLPLFKRHRRASNLQAGLRQSISARRGFDLATSRDRNHGPPRSVMTIFEMLQECCNHSVSHGAVLRIKTV